VWPFSNHQSLIPNLIPNPSSLHHHLVGRIKLGEHNIQNGHGSDRPVNRPRRNEHAGSRLERESLAVQLNLSVCVALEDIVGFGQAAVIVRLGVDGDFGTVYRAREQVRSSQCPARRTARAGDRRNGVKIDELIARRF